MELFKAFFATCFVACVLAVAFSEQQVPTENLDAIDALNKVHPLANFGFTKFSHLTRDEFRKTMLMQKHPQTDAFWSADFKNTYVPSESAIDATPDSYDWVSQGVVTPVKDQGTVGTCWAFSTTGNIEGQWNLSGNALTSLSEEFLVDCDSNDCGVFGGWPYRAYQYIMGAQGIPSEEAYPYCSGTGNCYPCMADHNISFCGEPPEYCNRTWDQVHCPANDWIAASSISNWMKISSNETLIKTAVYEIGPLSVLMDATGLQNYRSGVWAPNMDSLFGCTTDDLDHAVLIVGYGNENGTDYWLVKNSWGQDWGMDGYFKIIRGKGECGINTAVTTSCIGECKSYSE